MFGVGPQEVVGIVLLLLVIFGPGKAVSMARDLGRLANEARDHVEEFKGELLDGDGDRAKPVSGTRSEEAGDGAHEREEGGELPRQEEEAPSKETRAQTIPMDGHNERYTEQKL